MFFIALGWSVIFLSLMLSFPQDNYAVPAASLTDQVRLANILKIDSSGAAIDSKIDLSDKKDTIYLENFLLINGVPPDMRAMMYSLKSCGARRYQYLTIRHPEGYYRILHPCSGQCLLFNESSPSLKSSEARSLPQEFCATIWGESLTIYNRDGL